MTTLAAAVALNDSTSAAAAPPPRSIFRASVNELIRLIDWIGSAVLKAPQPLGNFASSL
jgi:hypothetical protein